MTEKIKYQFRAGWSKRRISFKVQPNGVVMITKHPRIPVWMAKKLVNTKLDVIHKHLEFFKSGKIYDWKNYKPVSVPEALQFVKAKIKKFNAYYNFLYGTIGVKDYKGMWGACVNRKNLVFNSRMLALPEEQADYIIVHELCHLKEFNHSKKFWKLVAEAIPDYKRIKKDLKLYSFY